MASEDANSKLIEMVTEVDVDAEKCVDDSLVQIWKLRFGHKIKFQSRIPDFEHKVWSRFWSWSSSEILKLKFGQYFADDALLRLWCLIFVETLKLGLVMILKFEF